MPLPVSVTRMATNSPRSPSSTALPLSTTGLAVMPSAPPFGIASRAFTARLSSASSSSLGSTLIAQLLLRNRDLDGDVAAQRPVEHLLELGKPLREIDHRRGEHLPARECEQLAGEAFAARGRVRDHVEQPRMLFVGQVAPQALHAAADDHQQIVEVVRDAAGQLPDRLQALGLPQRAFGGLAPLRLVMQPRACDAARRR